MPGGCSNDKQSPQIKGREIIDTTMQTLLAGAWHGRAWAGGAFLGPSWHRPPPVQVQDPVSQNTPEPLGVVEEQPTLLCMNVCIRLADEHKLSATLACRSSAIPNAPGATRNAGQYQITLVRHPAAARVFPPAAAPAAGAAAASAAMLL